MTDLDLSDSIENMCEDDVYAWFSQGKIKLDGSFTVKELYDIVELLKTERKELI